jgi:peptidoglycan LD-endopeptidase LytH
MSKKKRVMYILTGISMTILIGGLLVPERLIIPVQGATPADWNVHSFWFRPWGKSGVHRGIDIFAREGTPVIAASSGVVIFSGVLGAGGNAVAILGPKWRVHYYAHLRTRTVNSGSFVSRGEAIGSVGTTGNAVGKPPHLHYSVITQLPYPWRYKAERFGFDRMFYLDPNERLKGSTPTKDERLLNP